MSFNRPFNHWTPTTEADILRREIQYFIHGSFNRGVGELYIRFFQMSLHDCHQKFRRGHKIQPILERAVLNDLEPARHKAPQDFRVR